MSDQADNKVIPLPQVDTESKLLAHFERVRAELATINTIEEALKVRGKAELLRILAIKIQAAKSTLDSISEVRVRAERKLGQLISDRPETRGGDRRSEDFQRYSGMTFENSESPTLAALGVSKNLSSRSQIIATIPDEEFEERIRYTIKHLNRGRDLSAEMLDFAKFLKREQERQERREEASAKAAEAEPDDRIQVRHGDFREILKDVPDNSVQLILTDPVYSKEQISDWSALSFFASRVLNPGKLLACYTSTNILAESIKRLSEHLQYVWTFAVVYPACGKPHHQYRLNGWWKPILLFSNGSYQPETNWINRDVIHGDGLTKEHHEWEQGLREAEYLIENLTYENDLVVDPFLGSGTVALAAKRLNRRLVGCDENEDAVNTTLARFAQEEGV